MRFTLGKRILMVLVVPLMAALGFATVTLVNSVSVWRETTRIAVVARAAPLFGHLVHEVQAERGLTNTVLRAAGNEEAMRQREAAMGRVDRALEALEAESARLGEEPAATTASELRESLRRLRADVSARALDPPAAVARYNAIVGVGIGAIERGVGNASVPSIAKVATVYSALLRAKDMAGLERATGAGAYSPEGFAADQYERFVQLGAGSATWLDIARRSASETLKAAIAGYEQSEAARAAAQARRTATQAVFDKGKGMASLAWFDLSTRAIDVLKGVEDRAAEALMTEVTKAHDEASNQLIWTTGAVGLGLLASLGLGLWQARSITTPILRLTRRMQAMAQGDLQTPVEGRERRDELGQQAETLEVFRNGLREAERLRAEQAEHAERAQALLRAERNALADRFDQSMGTLAAAFVASASAVQNAAQNLSATAEETTRQAQSVAGAAVEASSNVATIAAATEQLSASVSEIASKVGQSALMADKAAQEARRTEAEVNELLAFAESIGQVIDLINSIAGQTNLLALNATIEAARAGDAGKGFTVVASEVKQLAGQTAEATDEIARKVQEVQTATNRTVGSIGAIVTMIGQIQEMSNAVAAAVEQQGAATADIAGNTSHAADRAGAVTVNIAGVGEAAEITGTASLQLMRLSDELSKQADTLRGDVETFVQGLRAG